MRQNKKLPDFDKMTYEEEAKWWDTHSLADYWDEFEVVEARFAEKLTKWVNVRVDLATFSRLRAQAHKKGVGATTLARMWILEKLDKLGRKYKNRQAKRHHLKA
jgi:hypothetical protein